MPFAHGEAMSKVDYKTKMARIQGDYKTERAACSSMSGNQRDICIEEAKSKERIARAELEYAYTAKASDRNDVLVAKAEGTYAVAKERCDDKSGDDRSACVKEAKAVESAALADAKMGREYSGMR